MLAEIDVAKAVSPVELVWWGHILVISDCFQLLPNLPFSSKSIIFVSRIRVNTLLSVREV